MIVLQSGLPTCRVFLQTPLYRAFHYFEIVDERAVREYGDIKPVHGDKIVKLVS